MEKRSNKNSGRKIRMFPASVNLMPGNEPDVQPAYIHPWRYQRVRYYTGFTLFYGLHSHTAHW